MARLRSVIRARFRTIQVCPRDLASALRQAKRAVTQPERGGGVGAISARTAGGADAELAHLA
jgi:hypothetical protein